MNAPLHISAELVASVQRWRNPAALESQRPGAVLPQRGQNDAVDVETGAKAVVVINLAAQSYREGKTLYWDEKHWKASDKPVKA